MSALRRATIVGAGLLALSAGLLLGTVACTHCYLEPIEGGRYEIVASPERPELVGVIVEIGEDTVEIDFTDTQGNDWAVTYAITSRYP
jgi:hypothetical protein